VKRQSPLPVQPDLTPDRTSEGSAQLKPQLTPPVKPKACDKGVRIVYVPGFNDDTDGSWAAKPLSDALRAKGVKVLNEPPKRPDKIDYLAVHGGLPEDDKVGNDGRDKLLAHLKNKKKVPADVCIALIGYSTGVIAIQRALDVVPTDVGARIVSVESFANPSNIAITKPVNKTYSGRVMESCNATDPLCGKPAHFTPVDEQLKECKAALERAMRDKSKWGSAKGPCFTPGHLPPAYADEAKALGVDASLLVAGPAPAGSSHAVASGDTLWDLAAKAYGDGSKWQAVYSASRDAIEKAARDHGFTSSDNGHWIFPKTPLTIPPTA
jgi:LysM repeat protein